MTDGRRGLTPVLPSLIFPEPSALTTQAHHTIYIPENEPFALFSPIEHLKFIEFFFFYFAKYTQFEAWSALCSIILSCRRCQHGQQSVTAWTSRSLKFLQHRFLKKREKYVKEYEQSLNSDTRDLLGNSIKINNLRVYSVLLQSIL